MPNVQVHSVCTAALLRLPEKAVETTIHSRVRRACHLTLADGLFLMIVPEDLGNLPGGVLLKKRDWECFAACGWAEGDPIRVSRQAIGTSQRNLRLDLRHARRWKPSLILPRLAANHEIRSRLEAALHFFDSQVSPGRDKPASSYRHRFCIIHHRAGDLSKALVNADPDRIRQSVTELIGLGPGLTPSGDDFLLGALLTLNLLESRQPHLCTIKHHLGEACTANAHRTTDVGASYLRYAASGVFAEVPVEFARRLLSPADGWLAAAMRLGRIGATSGADLGRGIIETAGSLLLRVPLFGE